jgi:hypothetical protein
MRIKFSRRQITGFVLAALLLALNSAMRYGIWKRVQSCNLDKTRFEKLDLAYRLKGQAGLDYELANMARHSAAASFARQTASQLKAVKDSEVFLKSSLAQDRDEINRLKSGRFWVSCVIFAVLACQVCLNVFCWLKDNQHHFRELGKK